MSLEFGTAGNKNGVEIWRIENMKPVLNKDALAGNFFVGDSYVLLNTRLVGYRWEIHFWLGKESTQDEMGAAAILSVKLNEYIGDKAIIYRQTQENESSEFMALFKKGIKYMKGGIDSGFKHANTNTSLSKRLLHIKGRRVIRANEVPLEWRSFNHGDCFLLDYKNTLYQWNGNECNVFEKVKAHTLATDIINYEKGGKGAVIKIEDGEDIPKAMLQVLEGTPADIQDSIPDDDVATERKKSPATLYHVCADDGPLVITKVGFAPFNQNDLDSGDSYILDNGSFGKIFVWKGKGASQAERVGALTNAEKFINDKGYTRNTNIEVMAEGAESTLFKQFFKNWKNKDASIGFGKVYTNNRIAKVEQVKFEMKSLGDSKLAAKHRMMDDGSGKLDIWRVQNGLKSMDAAEHGIFFGSHCYIMLYRPIGCGGMDVIYFWHGNRAPLKDITSASFMVVKFAHERGNSNTQIRTVQGKEPPHLLSLFGGNPMIIISGKSRSIEEETLLLQIFCTGVGGRAIQVETSASSLNSNDAFLLKTKTKTFIWIGLGASEDEMSGAKYVAAKLKASSPLVIKEGSETVEFWLVLGGKKEYANHPRLQQDHNENPPRLFGISDATGCLKVEEVPGDFTQADLCEDDVMMLDVWDQVFVWIGRGATEQERDSSPGMAKEYIQSDPRQRDGTPVVTLTQGNEPLMFTGFFPSWNKSFDYKQSA